MSDIGRDTIENPTSDINFFTIENNDGKPATVYHCKAVDKVIPDEALNAILSQRDCTNPESEYAPTSGIVFDDGNICWVTDENTSHDLISGSARERNLCDKNAHIDLRILTYFGEEQKGDGVNKLFIYIVDGPWGISEQRLPEVVAKYNTIIQKLSDIAGDASKDIIVETSFQIPLGDDAEQSDITENEGSSEKYHESKGTLDTLRVVIPVKELRRK